MVAQHGVTHAIRCSVLCALLLGCASPEVESSPDSSNLGQTTFTDTDGDGLPDARIHASEGTGDRVDLLRQRVALCEEALELGERRAASVQKMYEAGRAGIEDASAAQAAVLEHRIRLIDARLELLAEADGDI